MLRFCNFCDVVISRRNSIMFMKRPKSCMNVLLQLFWFMKVVVFMDFDNHFVFKAWAQQKASSAYISFLVKGPNGPRTKQLSYTLRAQRWWTLWFGILMVDKCIWIYWWRRIDWNANIFSGVLKVLKFSLSLPLPLLISSLDPDFILFFQAFWSLIIFGVHGESFLQKFIFIDQWFSDSLLYIYLFHWWTLIISLLSWL